MVKSKKKTKKKGESRSDDKEWCPCGVHDEEEETCVECDDCEQWWHLKCVSLEGLTEGTIKGLVKWRCPRCIMKTLGMGSTIIQDAVKSEIEKAVPGIVKSVVEATIKAKEFKKTFADVAAGRAESSQLRYQLRVVERAFEEAVEHSARNFASSMEEATPRLGRCDPSH